MRRGESCFVFLSCLMSQHCFCPLFAFWKQLQGNYYCSCSVVLTDSVSGSAGLVWEHWSSWAVNIWQALHQLSCARVFFAGGFVDEKNVIARRARANWGTWEWALCAQVIFWRFVVQLQVLPLAGKHLLSRNPAHLVSIPEIQHFVERIRSWMKTPDTYLHDWVGAGSDPSRPFACQSIAANFRNLGGLVWQPGSTPDPPALQNLLSAVHSLETWHTILHLMDTIFNFKKRKSSFQSVSYFFGRWGLVGLACLQRKWDPVDGQAVHISCAILTSLALWGVYRVLSDVQVLTGQIWAVWFLLGKGLLGGFWEATSKEVG